MKVRGYKNEFIEEYSVRVHLVIRNDAYARVFDFLFERLVVDNRCVEATNASRDYLDGGLVAACRHDGVRRCVRRPIPKESLVMLNEYRTRRVDVNCRLAPFR